jgi:hypothetical protein
MSILTPRGTGRLPGSWKLKPIAARPDPELVKTAKCAVEGSADVLLRQLVHVTAQRARQRQPRVETDRIDPTSIPDLLLARCGSPGR